MRPSSAIRRTGGAHRVARCTGRAAARCTMARRRSWIKQLRRKSEPA